MGYTVRRILCYGVLLPFIASGVAGCGNSTSETKPARYIYNPRESDSLRNELNKDTVLKTTDSAYDSLLFSSWEDNKMRQLFYSVQDFHAYMSNVHYRFADFMDTTKMTGPVLTNTFIKNGAHTTGVLHGKMIDVTQHWRKCTNNPALLKRIEKLENITYKRFKTYDDLLQAYFSDQHPDNVTRILNSFDRTVKSIHYDVLKENQNITK